MNTSRNNRINRINYIVQENPDGVYQTLMDEGFKPSSDISTLIEQTKQWIQSDGKEAVLKLLRIHPEKEAIIIANKQEYNSFSGCGCKSSFDGSACGCKSSFDGSPCPCQSKSSFTPEYEKELALKSRKELQLQYKELKRLSKKFPEDQELKEEVELVWEHLNSKRKKKNFSNKASSHKTKGEVDSKAVFSVTSKDLAIGSLVFGLALIISQIK